MTANATRIMTPGIRPLVNRASGAVLSYQMMIQNWNEARRGPGPESSQLHPFELGNEFTKRRLEMTSALDDLFRAAGIMPRGWQTVFPPVVFRREEEKMFLSGQGGGANTEQFSRGVLWGFFLNDTLRYQWVTRRALKKFPEIEGLYPLLHQAWGHQAITRMQAQILLRGAENLTPVGNTPSIVASTHDSALEIPILPAVLLEYGIQLYFVADKKYFSGGGILMAPLRFLLGSLDIYGHIRVDRSNQDRAKESMREVGATIQRTGRSFAVFPQMTRTPVCYDEDGNRFEGPMYGCRGGIAWAFDGTDIPVIPVGFRNGARIFPKQAGDPFLRRGAALGLTYEMLCGQPFRQSDLASYKGEPPTGKRLFVRVIHHLDQTFGELTGREVGPPAPSKDDRVRKARRRRAKG